MQPLMSRVETQGQELAGMRATIEDARRRIAKLEHLIVGDLTLDCEPTPAHVERYDP